MSKAEAFVLVDKRGAVVVNGIGEIVSTLDPVAHDGLLRAFDECDSGSPGPHRWAHLTEQPSPPGLADEFTRVAALATHYRDALEKITRDTTARKAGLIARHALANPQLAAAPPGVQAQQQGQQWQPIETAPRGSGEDGPDSTTHPDYVDPPLLLLSTAEGIVVGHYDWYYHEGYGRGAEPGVSAWRDHNGEQTYGASHWMPLPPAPLPTGFCTGNTNLPPAFKPVPLDQDFDDPTVGEAKA